MFSKLNKPRKVDRRSDGFTLIELLVVIAIIGILVAILLPAVQSAREAGRRASCVNNVKQMVLAMHNFSDTRNQLPPGGTHVGPIADWDQPTADLKGIAGNWLTYCLPYLEQNALWDDFQTHVTSGSPLDGCNNDDDYSRQRFPLLKCPSNPANLVTDLNVLQIERLARGNYAACFGAGNLKDSWTTQNLKGAFGVMHEDRIANGTRDIVRFTNVTDGTSNTLAMSEVKFSANASDCRGVWAIYTMGSSSFSTAVGPNSTVGDRVPRCLDTKMAPCGTDDPSSTQIGAARSYHPGGVVTGMVDGSTRFVTNSIDLTTWMGLGTRMNNELVAPN